MEDKQFNEEIFNLDMRMEEYTDKVRCNPDLQKELIEFMEVFGDVQSEIN